MTHDKWDFFSWGGLCMIVGVRLCRTAQCVLGEKSLEYRIVYNFLKIIFPFSEYLRCQNNRSSYIIKKWPKFQKSREILYIYVCYVVCHKSPYSTDAFKYYYFSNLFFHFPEEISGLDHFNYQDWKDFQSLKAACCCFT